MVSFATLAKIDIPSRYSEISQSQRRRVREKYIELQGGKCYYCKKPLDQTPKDNRNICWSKFPEGFLNHPIHLHHNHRTDLTLGAVHAYCNAVLWQYHGE